MKKILIIFFFLPLLLATNTAKAQSCSAGETEINFIAIGAAGFTDYVLLQQTTGASSFFFNTESVFECISDEDCFNVTVAGNVTFEVYQGGILVASPINGETICFPFVTYIYGCTDLSASNFDALANTDDGSCVYAKTYVPDDNFEAYLEANGMGDGLTLNDSVLTSNINTSTSLNLSYEDIADLTGIEDFISLINLNCSNNQLTSLDVSANTALTYLYCSSNEITSLNVSDNISLSEFDCSGNQITSLNLSANVALSVLQCSNNQLTSLDVSNNIALQTLNCHVNQLTSLDVSNNTVLQALSCEFNQLNNLDVSANAFLIWLKCYNNDLTSLDVRNGNNTSFLIFQATVNTNLNCIDVDNVAWANANWTTIDAQSYFSTNCPPVVFGCTDILACNYSSSANVDDGSCDLPNGCGDSLYLEYAASVTCSDGLACLTLIVNGCIDVVACNYSSSANVDDGSCDLPNGCGDSLYLEYAASVTCSDGLACLTLIVNGCTDVVACNYSSSANVDDGSCDLPNGCGDSLYLEYDAAVTCPTANACVTLIVTGCMSSIACNYDPNANVDDGSCLTAFGCMDALSCNYDSTATCDDISCVYPSSSTSIITACDSYDWNGQSIPLSGSYDQNFTNASGCDSTVTLNLTIINSTSSTATETECNSYTWSVNGSTYTSSVIDTLIGVNAAGCADSSILDLTINYSTISTYNQVACNSYTWPVNGLTYTSPSIINVINVNAAGCPETSILNLTISGNPVANILLNGFDLEVTISDIYYWSTSEITQTITPAANGWYWCIVTDVNGCIGDTAFYEVINIVSVVNETINSDRKIIKITDMLGKETPYIKNTPLFYIYDDGIVEKRIVIE
jgi:hypothetical protein